MKFLKIAGLGVLILLLAGYFVVAYALGSVVKGGVNNFGPKLTQTNVELAGAQISPFTGKGSLSGLTVGNPKGWSDNRAFYLGKVQLDLEPGSVFGDTVVINEIVVDQPEFNYETRILTSNIKDLLKNIESFTGGGGAQEPVTKDGKPRKFIVKKFLLTNGKATVGLGASAIAVTLPPISLTDLGTAKGGVTAGELGGAIMREVLNKVIVATASAVQSGDLSVDKLKDAAKDAGSAIKKLFEKK
ncbi:MAG TPA: hypothetical protein VG734_14790 [Lacunisphaera sp.]|nr:hypothetical protein [Lacunisphaera sp.]